ncbi:MAG: DNA-processing protein DprA [Patescibacteria group bacterium]
MKIEDGQETIDRGNLIFERIEDLFANLDGLKSQKGQLWFGISGSWRKTNKEVEENVREVVRKIIARGDGIVSGGALNVDYFATDEALKLSHADRVKIFLPTALGVYATHYRMRAAEGVITPEQAEGLITQLENLYNANTEALAGNPQNTVIDKETYFNRNTEVVNASDALVAFQVNESEGVGDTVTKSLMQRKPVCIKKYVIE